MARLRDICEIAAGQGAPQGENSYCNYNEGIPFIKAGDLSDLLSGKLETEIQCVNEIVAKQHKLKLYPAGSILFAKSGMSCMKGYVYRTKNPCYIVSHLAIVIPQGIDGEYLKYYFQHNKPNALIKDSAYPSISLQDISNIELTVPSLDIQASIASELNKVNMLISLRKQQLSKLDELVKSRFIELFGDPKHSDKYSTRKLSSCVANKADMVDGPFGSQVNTKFDYIENGEIPVIRTVNVKMMQFSADDLKFMSREKYETVIRSQVLPGDVILTKVGTIGNVCIFPNEYKEAVLSTTGSCRIRVDESIINKVFFAYNLMYLKDKLLEIASTGVQPFLNMNHIKNIDVLDVPFEEQLLFAAFVEQTNKSKLTIQKSLDKLETLKKALMQKYFG